MDSTNRVLIMGASNKEFTINNGKNKIKIPSGANVRLFTGFSQFCKILNLNSITGHSVKLNFENPKDVMIVFINKDGSIQL